MKFINLFLLSCQIAIVLMVLSLWQVELPHEQQGSNCSAPVGHPESLKLGGQTYHYLYDTQGRVVSRAGEFIEYRMEYVRQHDYPVSVSEIIHDEAGNEIARRTSRFIYDDQHGVIAATNSDGANIRISYNTSRQMSEIQDATTGTHLNIEYDPKCGKPNKLTQTGVGSVEVTYDNGCEVDTVDQNTDPRTAMHISSLFNRLLEATAPAYMDWFH